MEPLESLMKATNSVSKTHTVFAAIFWHSSYQLNNRKGKFSYYFQHRTIVNFCRMKIQFCL